MVDIKWSNDALLDLDTISEYSSQDSPENAKKFIQEIPPYYPENNSSFIDKPKYLQTLTYKF